MSEDRRAPTGVRGAVYLPTRAGNAYWQWAGYDRAVVDRDVGYADALNLNALRVFLSYEYWREDERAFATALDHLLDRAAARGVGVVPILFESAGAEPTPERLDGADPRAAPTVHSPSALTIRDASNGLLGSLRRRIAGDDPLTAPRAFARWVARRYGDDDRVLALEVMNEPGGWDARVAFAREMLRAVAAEDPAVPLTMGCKRIANNRTYDDPGLDVYQFHYNVPPTADHMAAHLDEAAAVARADGAAVWLTEWQRTRERPPDVLEPHYASLAQTIRGSDVDGDFFWSLMLRRAHLPNRRRRGRINGVFHEDGAVWRRDDAETLAGESLDRSERRDRPASPE